MMKSPLIIIALLIFSNTTSFAQANKNEDKEMYPKKYTFEKAKEFETKGELEKALWYYINLYNDDKAKTVDAVKAITEKPEGFNIGSQIKRTFSLYGTFDPAVSAGTYPNGELKVDMPKLREKKKWSDELTSEVEVKKN